MSLAVSTTLPDRGAEPELLASRDILCVRAPNPGPLTLSGTNTWLVERDPTWVVDPGPADDAHSERVLQAIAARGGLGGIALTHAHADHSGAVGALLAQQPAALAAAGAEADVALGEGTRFGPFEALPTPGHAPDHVALIARRACFSGDAVLGEGSVFVSPGKGALAGYLAALARLRARDDFDVLCPGHGPVVWEARAKLSEYLEHRADRERRLKAALEQGRRSVAELLAAAWPEVPTQLQAAASITLAAHLDKLDDEGLLPPGVERPDPPRRPAAMEQP
jgi:glyoxylase-like metal-dependent hydrolase (beta-lactamase superfamily II)